MDTNNLTVISTELSQLPEKGWAYLVDQDGNVRARFFNGNQMGDYMVVGNTEITKAA